MASILKTSINLNNIPKDKIIVGNNGPVIVEQTKEEREAKVAKTYLGNVKVVWTNGSNVAAAQRQEPVSQKTEVKQEDDLPF